MAGHSQFKNIMHKKGKQDAIRSKLFSKLAREITVAAKLGLPDPAMNARLRAAVHRGARRKHAEGQYRARHQESDAAPTAKITTRCATRAMRPGGVAVIVEALTDNRNRTAGEVRSYFTKAGGALAETGAVSFMFDRVGLIDFRPRSAVRGRDAGGRDRSRRGRRQSSAEGHEIITVARRRCAMSRRRSRRNSASRARRASIWRPQNTIAVDDEAGEKILKPRRPARGQ